MLKAKAGRKPKLTDIHIAAFFILYQALIYDLVRITVEGDEPETIKKIV